MPRRPAALFALALAFAAAVVASVAAPAAAQAVPGLLATLTVPSSTTVGVPVQATAVFTPPAGSTAPLQDAIRLQGATTNATLTVASSTSGELTGCIPRITNTQVRCDWTPAGGGPQTLTVTINPVAVSIFSVAATGAPSGGNQTGIVNSPFAITQQAPPTSAATTVATTPAPTTPTSAGVAPTSAAATTQAAALPPTGGSDANAFIALAVLALGAVLVIMARKFREA